MWGSRELEKTGDNGKTVRRCKMPRIKQVGEDFCWKIIKGRGSKVGEIE